ncbi:MAG: permease prefix domain 1-containing protein [Longimicrobiales bacterium]
MTPEDHGDALESQIAEWRDYLRRRQAIHSVDVDELEDHLRGQVGTLKDAGLSDDEAFLVAVKRMGDLNTLSREFAREYSERLWKQLVVAPADEGGDPTTFPDAMMAIGFAVAAGVAIKLPALFGVGLSEENAPFYVRNFSLFVLPLLAGYFALKRRVDSLSLGWLAVPFALGAVLTNAFPFAPDGQTFQLVAMHLPIALWLSVGYAYVGGHWRDHSKRMDFIRFSGEWFIYYALIALGGGVLMGFTMFVFSAIGLDAEWFLESWLLPCGVVGAVIISAWLVEAKQSVIENMAPVLTRLFTPLFAAVLLVFLVTMVLTGSGIDVEREVLIGFDLLLVVILALLLYAISARNPNASPDAFDALQLLLVVCALIIDVLALIAIAARISEFGFSPNKVAALGENLVLLVNLAGSAVLYARFLRGRIAFGALERWQTGYLPVFVIWFWFVVIAFPPLFGFR